MPLDLISRLSEFAKKNKIVFVTPVAGMRQRSDPPIAFVFDGTERNGELSLKCHKTRNKTTQVSLSNDRSIFEPTKATFRKIGVVRATSGSALPGLAPDCSGSQAPD